MKEELKNENYTPKFFKNLEEINSLISKADNYNSRIELQKKLIILKKNRPDFFLTLDELNEIFQWKLRGQINRQRSIRENNTNENIIAITKAAYQISHEKDDIEIKLKLRILTSIEGVGIPVASAILTLVDPNKFAVIDFRNRKQIFPHTTSKSTYSINEYILYLNTIKAEATFFNLNPQDIDIALWQKYIELL